MKTITVHNLDQHPTRPYTECVDLQGDFKDYVYLDRLVARIRDHGFKYDFLVWESSDPVEHHGVRYPAGTPFIVDAHARQRALARLANEGYSIPPVPYTRIFAASYQDAKEELLYLNSRYGEIQPTSSFLTELIASAGDLSHMALPELSALPEFDDRPEISFASDPDDAEEDDSPSEGGPSGSGGMSSSSGSSLGVIPLAIVLKPGEYHQWQQYKADVQKRTDTQAFLYVCQEQGVLSCEVEH